MLKKLLSITTFLALSAASFAWPLSYAFRIVPVRAGVLVIDSQQTSGYRANWSPHVFYNIDSNKLQKPGGWSFYNPFAPTRMTQPMIDRWTAINSLPAYGGGTIGALDSLVTKRHAPYWEVVLSQASETQLTQYDVLHLSAYGNIQLNSLEREKLRRFLESGGTLWVDFTSDVRTTVSLDVVNGFPLSFGLNTNNLGIPSYVDFFHPLLSYPFPISSNDMSAMAGTSPQISLNAVDLDALGLGDLKKLQAPTEYEFNWLTPVAVDNFGPYVTVGQVGEGHIVVTSRGVGTAVNRSVNASGNYIWNGTFEAAKPSFDRSSDAATKLIVNMIGLSVSHAQSGKGSRKSSSARIDVGAPALKKFEFPSVMDGTNYRYTPPAIFKGLTIASIGNQIVALDSDPDSDLDRDGNPDDGIQDFSLGENRDVVWTSSALNGPISAPTCAEVNDGAVVNQVAVVDATGSVQLFDAFPATPAANMAPVATAPPPTAPFQDFSLPGPGPYAPTYHDGMYFVSDMIQVGVSTVGRVWLIQASTFASPGGGAWTVGSNTSQVLARPSASPTVGYIQVSDGSGALDRVVYVPTRATGVGGGSSTAGFASLWLGAKGEKPFSSLSSGGFLRCVLRCHLQGLRTYLPNENDPLGVKLTVIDQNGNPLNGAQMNVFFDGFVNDTGGFVSFRYKAGQSLPANYSVRVDYTIDWGISSPGYAVQILRGNVLLPDDISRRRRVIGNLALGPEGNIHLVHADTQTNTTGGAYYIFKEYNRGEFRMMSRYEMFRQHQVSLNGAPAQSYAETLFDTDPVTGLAPGNILGGAFSQLTFRSGPAVHNGITYVTARGVKNGFIPCTILMAFNANPPIPEIAIGDVPGSFSIVQPDMGRSDNKAIPNVYSQFSQNQFVYERESGAERGVIRLENLMATTRGFAGNSINLSQPVIIRRVGQPDALFEPDRAGSRWSPLQYYMVFHGAESQSAPVGTGNTVFYGLTSYLPYFIRNGFGFPPPTAPEAIVLGLNSNIAPNDPFLASNATRPWMKQLYVLKTNPTFQGNPNLKWPQTEGAQTFDDWAIRLLQTSLGSTTDTSFGVVAGENTIVSWSERGPVAFSKADYVVCDEGRVARFDASGNPIWTSDTSSRTGLAGDSGFAGTSRPLVRPTRAYPINQREMMVVDTGANRIIRLDISGREVRSISRILLDPNFLPEGFREGAPLDLKQPRDVLFYTSTQLNPANMTNPRPRELWLHYLVADAGNQRIVELIDRYEADVATGRLLGPVRDGNNVEQLGVLYWHTPDNVSGKNYVYTSLSRVYLQNVGRYVYAAGIGGAMPTRADFGLDLPTAANTQPREENSGNGGVLIIDGPNTQIVNEVDVPIVSANAYYDFGTNTFNSVLVPARKKKLGNLSSVTMRNVIDATFGPRTAIMFTDSEGVFEIIQPAPNGPWVVRWMLTREAYRAIRRTVPGNIATGQNAFDFRANYAKRLDNGEILVVNGYYGRLRNNAEFQGEVLQLDGAIDTSNNNLIDGFGFGKQNLGFKLTSIKAELPPVTGARGLVVPVFADRR